MARTNRDATLRNEDARIAPCRDAAVCDRRPLTAVAASPEQARLTALRLSLLRAARRYFEVTGTDLPIYQEIARVHAALFCDVPLRPNGAAHGNSGVEVLALPPFGTKAVEVDLSRRFATLVVVRITEDFACEAGMIPRSALPPNAAGLHSVRWETLPHLF